MRFDGKIRSFDLSFSNRRKKKKRKKNREVWKNEIFSFFFFFSPFALARKTSEPRKVKSFCEMNSHSVVLCRSAWFAVPGHAMHYKFSF